MSKKLSKHDKWLRKIGFKEGLAHLGIFDFNVVLALGSQEHLEEYVRFKLEDPDFELSEHTGDYGARGMYFYKAPYCPILWIPRKPQTPEEYGTLAHEALHIVFRVFKWAGMEMNEETEEVATHATGFLVRKVIEL